MASEIEWRKLRADELRARAREDAIVIVPVGSLEQHGPHLPVEVDSMLGETVAQRTARLVAEKEPCLVLPMLWTGLSEHHMSFGGTITLDDVTFLAVLRCICRSIVRHGFRRIVLLNGHGGNDNAMRMAADMLTPELEVPIIQFTYWYAAAEPIAAILETQKGLRHACEAETSMMMALRPELVARDRIAIATAANTTPEVSDLVGGGVYRWRTLGAMSSAGVVGNPDAATPEKGERLLAGIAAELARKLTNKDLWAQPFLSDRVQP
ncbi:MAG: creatininase family protein [Alphaproteobacteria bacterium]|nr:creatininase family protein [Alphaproteobacteria bacterium]